MNQIVIIGNCGRDTSSKTINDKPFAETTVAVYNPSDKEKPDWFDVKAWGKTAEIMTQYVKKGTKIAVVGNLKIDKWQDKNTQEWKSRVFINANSIELLSAKSDNKEENYKDVPF